MDYKKAVDVSNKEVVDNVLIRTKCWDDITKALDELMPTSPQKVGKRLQDLYCYIIEDNETNLEELIKSLKNNYFFKGMLEDLKVQDAHEILCECCSFTKCEDEDGTFLSDEEEIEQKYSI